MVKLTILAKNTMGYGDEARRIVLDGTIGAYTRYASAAFAPKLSLRKNEEAVDRIHRLVLICCGKLYRTVSYLPATVICAWMPWKYEVTIRAWHYSRRKKKNLPRGAMLLPPPKAKKADEMDAEMKEVAMKEWQMQWDTSNKGRWTNTLIPKVTTTRRKMSFWLAQALSGHGVFGSYLRKMNRRANSSCLCGEEMDARTCLQRVSKVRGGPARYPGCRRAGNQVLYYDQSGERLVGAGEGPASMRSGLQSR